MRISAGRSRQRAAQRRVGGGIVAHRPAAEIGIGLERRHIVGRRREDLLVGRAGLRQASEAAQDRGAAAMAGGILRRQHDRPLGVLQRVVVPAELVQHRRPVVEEVRVLRIHHDGAAELGQAFLVAAGIAERAAQQAHRLRILGIELAGLAEGLDRLVIALQLARGVAAIDVGAEQPLVDLDRLPEGVERLLQLPLALLHHAQEVQRVGVLRRGFDQLLRRARRRFELTGFDQVAHQRRAQIEPRRRQPHRLLQALRRIARPPLALRRG